MISVMRKVALGEITTPSTSITTDVVLEAGAASAKLRYEFDRDGVIFGGGVRFDRPRAHRHRTESLCTAWHIEGCYDTVAEVLDSEWVTELIAARHSGTGQFAMHHFMLYVDSAGCYEVVAASWELLPDVRVG